MVFKIFSGDSVEALEPWLDQVVIIGGWAHQLYRLDPHAQQLDYPPLTTLDTDIAVPPKLPVGQQDIREGQAKGPRRGAVGSWLMVSRKRLSATVVHQLLTIVWEARLLAFMRSFDSSDRE